ncbi:MAG: long-chain-fatty-acid--CoA ligase [Microthrixaceae bacterium]
MYGLMGEHPLTLDLLARRAEEWFGHKEIRSAGRNGITTTTYSMWAERVRRVGGALDVLGVGGDSFVASLMWSTVEHAELYFGIPGSGRVLHTLNPRFTDAQLAFVIGEAGDEAVFVHDSLLDKLVGVLPACPRVRRVIVVGDPPSTPTLPPNVEVHRYEDVVAAAPPSSTSVGDERRAAMLCHTGGTTGDPKGVLSSHRSLVLHAMAVTSAGGIAIAERDVVMPVVPLFHANAVGFVHAAVGTGATLVLPGTDLSGKALASLLEEQRVSVTCGVPTIWSAVVPEMRGRSVPALRTVISGASAVPPSLSERFREVVGVPLTQIFGMTETSPLATIVGDLSVLAAADDPALVDARASVGVPVLGVEVRIVGEDGDVIADAESAGELQVRGPWIASGYLAGRSPESIAEDGWLRTGDIAMRGRDGLLRIVDRIKDVVKSGGEWISSIALENLLMGHDTVAEAAVVAAPDERWGERPVAFVVAAADATPDAEELRGFLGEHVPGWWVPERFEFVDTIPRTSVGKFSKKTLREALLAADQATS